MEKFFTELFSLLDYPLIFLTIAIILDTLTILRSLIKKFQPFRKCFTNIFLSPLEELLKDPEQDTADVLKNTYSENCNQNHSK